MKIAGVDPGIHGGLAIVVLNDGAAPQLVDAIDIPTVGVRAKERVDVIAFQTWLKMHMPDCAIVERAQAMPKQGASSGFKYGRATGAIEAAIVCSGIPMTIIEPSVWKRLHGLRALQIFPGAHSLLSRRKDHGRAEAALIALMPVPAITPKTVTIETAATISVSERRLLS